MTVRRRLRYAKEYQFIGQHTFQLSVLNGQFHEMYFFCLFVRSYILNERKKKKKNDEDDVKSVLDIYTFKSAVIVCVRLEFIYLDCVEHLMGIVMYIFSLLALLLCYAFNAHAIARHL